MRIRKRRGASLSVDHLILRWNGDRASWWDEGREGFAEALLPEHAGLYSVVNRVGASVQAAISH